MKEILDILLEAENTKPQTEKVKLKRLSTEENPAIFELKGLTFNRVAELKRLNSDEGFLLQTVLAGMISPDLKNKGLLDKYHAPTPEELLKKMLLPGEIEDLGREIERLSGYRTNTIEIVEDVKKK